MEPRYLNKESIKSLLPMQDCITAMETMFRDLAEGRILQPLRTLMWLPDRSGLLGMMPGYAQGPNIIGIKLITIFHANGPAGLPSHQGSSSSSKPPTATTAPARRRRTDRHPYRRRQCPRHPNTRPRRCTDPRYHRHRRTGGTSYRIDLPRPKDRRHLLWGRNPAHANALKDRLAAHTRAGGPRYPLHLTTTAQAAVEAADIICTVTSAARPIVEGHWIKPGAHLNVVGSCTPNSREVDSKTIKNSSLFTDRYESLFKEAGDFLIPKQEGSSRRPCQRGIGRSPHRHKTRPQKPRRDHPL